LVAGLVGVCIAAVVWQEVQRTGVEPVRGEPRYPALPSIAEKARPSPRWSARPVAAGLSVAEVLELSLRKIAADTSELELGYRPFAEACLASAPAGPWLASLKTASLRAGITVRNNGVTVGCDVARRNLVARADALKSELEATETHARTSGLAPGQWRSLLAKYQLEVWDRY
jgi:hypothetical protein